LPGPAEHREIQLGNLQPFTEFSHVIRSFLIRFPHGTGDCERLLRLRRLHFLEVGHVTGKTATAALEPGIGVGKWLLQSIEAGGLAQDGRGRRGGLQQGAGSSVNGADFFDGDPLFLRGKQAWEDEKQQEKGDSEAAADP
ncbi:MAG TPA: hypothetical protein PK988_07375, partial [Candidatus Sumerlaeota bacterium]|nr:hypothetical protein [Candidatus Sumerlaeota bacterium]